MLRAIILCCLIFTYSVAWCQQKPIISPASVQRLSSQICSCLTGETTDSAATQTAVRSCFEQAFAEQTEQLLSENQLENTKETGVQIGLLIVQELKKNCPVYLKATQNSPDQQLVNQAEVLRQKGDYRKANELYSRLINRSVILVDKTVFNDRGLCKLETGDYYGALADFEFALQRDTTYAVGYSNRGLAKHKLSDANGAFADYTKALALDSTQSTFYSNRGFILYEAEEYDASDQDFIKAISLNPSSATEYYYRGMIGRSQEKYTDTTVGYFNKAISLDPNNHVYINDRGLFFLNKKDLNAARADFMAVTKLQPDYNPSFYNLAVIRIEEKQYDDALRAIDAAIKIDTGYALYRDTRARILLAKAAYKEALRASDKAIELDPKRADYYDRRGEILEKMNNVAGAVEAYTKSIDLYNRDGAIYYRRGLLRLASKDKIGACEDFSTGKLLNDDDAGKAVTTYCTRP